jgi:serine/threonine-protein kinase HipA
MGRKVHHILPYDAPNSDSDFDRIFEDNQRRISISGVQEKYSLVLDRNKLRLTREGEHGTHILKPVPTFGKKADQMPANEHLTMQLARQVFNIETAENALIFFRNGSPAYIVKRFDVKDDGSKWAQDDFASLAQRMPQTHGEHYKYLGNYLELFEFMKRYLAAYKVESPKLLRLLMFNFLFSNGDAHFKNFSLLETPLGDYRLSPAYDLLNSRIHIDDKDFALDEGLLPLRISKGKVREQFARLAELAGISQRIYEEMLTFMTSQSPSVEKLVAASFLQEATKRNYWQSYQGRLKQLLKN